MEKNGEYIGEVLSLGSEGEGIIKLDGTTAFVPFCLAGESVSFKALKVAGSVAYGKLTEVHTLSSERVAPVCPHFEKCGGCQLQHASYNCQLDFKRQLVKNNLKKIGGLDVDVNPAVSSERQYGYRNKLALPVGVEGGETVFGFYAPRSHRIVPIKECPLQREWTKNLIDAVKEFMSADGLSGYDEDKRAGDIRHIVAREVEGKYVITIVATRNLPLEALADRLAKQFKKFTLLLNINGTHGNVIFGKEWLICRGEGFFYGEDEGIKYKAGANTFLQVNDGVKKQLYRSIVGTLREKNTVAIDLYSGGGLLTAMLSKACKQAYGIEVVKEAVDCADELKKINGLDNMFNICGTVEGEIDGVLKKTEGCVRAIVCDPPRKGMERSVVKAILTSGADNVVLVSCNPATLARDLGLLCGSLIENDGQIVKNPAYCGDPLAGFYEIVSVTPYDMFPQTKHVETLVVLGRKNAQN